MSQVNQTPNTEQAQPLCGNETEPFIKLTTEQYENLSDTDKAKYLKAKQDHQMACDADRARAEQVNRQTPIEMPWASDVYQSRDNLEAQDAGAQLADVPVTSAGINRFGESPVSLRDTFASMSDAKKGLLQEVNILKIARQYTDDLNKRTEMVNTKLDVVVVYDRNGQFVRMGTYKENTNHCEEFHADLEYAFSRETLGTAADLHQFQKSNGEVKLRITQVIY